MAFQVSAVISKFSGLYSSLMVLSLGTRSYKWTFLSPWKGREIYEALLVMKRLSKAKVDYQLFQAAVCINLHPGALSYVFGDLLQCDVSHSILQRIYLGHITPLQSSGGHLCLPSRWCSEVWVLTVHQRMNMKTCGQKDHFVREETWRNHWDSQMPQSSTKRKEFGSC